MTAGALECPEIHGFSLVSPMTEKNASPATTKPASREDRLAAALRENLRRRKEQGRDRQVQAAPAAAPSPSGDDSAG